MHNIRIGTAGWSIPKQYAEKFSDGTSHLERYARRFRAVEINSSFYRPHKPETYARWAASVPPDFRFSVKVPKQITHERRLVDIEETLQRFLSEIEPLEDKLGPLLLQLPPSLRFDEAVASTFFETLRLRFDGNVACEPRSPGWFDAYADRVFAEFRIARVVADPPPVPLAHTSGGWPRIIYRRLHGSPEIYRSSYDEPALKTLENALRASSRDSHESWCIFDNTTLGEATGNALDLSARFSG